MTSVSSRSFSYNVDEKEKKNVFRPEQLSGWCALFSMVHVFPPTSQRCLSKPRIPGPGHRQFLDHRRLFYLCAFSPLSGLPLISVYVLSLPGLLLSVHLAELYSFFKTQLRVCHWRAFPDSLDPLPREIIPFWASPCPYKSLVSHAALKYHLNILSWPPHSPRPH